MPWRKDGLPYLSRSPDRLHLQRAAHAVHARTRLSRTRFNTAKLRKGEKK